MTGWKYINKYKPLREMNLEKKTLSHVLSYDVIAEILIGSSDENDTEVLSANEEEFDAESFITDTEAVTEVFGDLEEAKVKELLLVF